MRKIVGWIFLILIVLGTWTFFKSWRDTSPLGIGTGRIAGKESDIAARDTRGIGEKAHSQLRGIADDPLRFQNQRLVVTGRVRGAGRLAANRNIYTLTQGDDRILVIDDKTPPKEYWPRTVNGVVKVVGPPIGGLRYAYLVDVREPAKFNAPSWSDIKDYFTHAPNS